MSLLSAVLVGVEVVAEFVVELVGLAAAVLI